MALGKIGAVGAGTVFVGDGTIGAVITPVELFGRISTLKVLLFVASYPTFALNAGIRFILMELSELPLF